MRSSHHAVMLCCNRKFHGFGTKLNKYGIVYAKFTHQERLLDIEEWFVYVE